MPLLGNSASFGRMIYIIRDLLTEIGQIGTELYVMLPRSEYTIL